MTLPNAAFLTPIRIEDLDRNSAGGADFNLRVTCNAVTETLAFATITDGRNYWASGDSQSDMDAGVGGTGDLCLLLQDCLRAHSEGSSFAVSISSTNRVTITCSSSFSILWNDSLTTLASAPFGFDQTDSTSGTSLTSQNQTLGAYCLETFIIDDSRWRAMTVGEAASSIAGSYRASYFGEAARERTVSFDMLPPSKALIEYQLADEPTGSFEWHWRNAFVQGKEMRFYEDASVRTSTSYSLAYLHPEQRDDPLKRDDFFRTEWTFELRMQEVQTDASAEDSQGGEVDSGAINELTIGGGTEL